MFKFQLSVVGAVDSIRSDTQYAYLPPDLFEHFTLNKWARGLTDIEAEYINKAQPTSTTVVPATPVVAAPAAPDDSFLTQTTTDYVPPKKGNK